MLNSLRGRLTLVMILLAVLPLVVVGGLLTYQEFNLERESAFSLKPLLISGNHDSSSGRPASFKAGTICGRYLPERLYA